MSDFFYRQAQAMQDPDEEGIVFGTTRIGMAGILRASGLFLLWHLLAWGWIVTGGTVWKGYKETAVTAHMGWTATPLSSPALDKGFEFNLPLFARAGEELVFNYQLESNFVAASGAFPVRIHVHCFIGCTAQNAQSMTINTAGKGELSVVLPRTSLYHVRIFQRANRDGSTSRGTFWWGTRTLRLEPSAN